MPAWTSEQAKQARSLRTHYPKLYPDKSSSTPVQPGVMLVVNDPGYIGRRLIRTRKQIRMLDKLLEKERDPSKLDRIASAIEKLSRIEQNLAGRPGPGQYKPTAPPKPSHSQDVEPG